MLPVGVSALGTAAPTPCEPRAASPGPIPSPARFPQKWQQHRRRSQAAVPCPRCVGASSFPIFPCQTSTEQKAIPPPAPGGSIPTSEKLGEPHQAQRQDGAVGEQILGNPFAQVMPAQCPADFPARGCAPLTSRRAEHPGLGWHGGMLEELSFPAGRAAAPTLRGSPSTNLPIPTAPHTHPCPLPLPPSAATYLRAHTRAGAPRGHGHVPATLQPATGTSATPGGPF